MISGICYPNVLKKYKGLYIIHNKVNIIFKLDIKRKHVVLI